MSQQKPPYLYHGSHHLLTELSPHPARGVGPEKDQLCAVYASHVPEFALIFALPILANEHGALAFEMLSFDPEKPDIVLHAGYLDLSQNGYLYRVCSDTFEPIDELQWVSYEPVVPVDYQIVDPTRYAHWVRRADQGEAGPSTPSRS